MALFDYKCFLLHSHMVIFIAVLNCSCRGIAKSLILLCTKFGDPKFIWSRMVLLFLGVTLITVHIIN